MTYGRQEGRQITALVAPPELKVRARKIQPTAEDIAVLEAAMHPDFYRAQAPDVDFALISPAGHYASLGWRAGLDPTADFSTADYLNANQDVASAGINPFLHFLTQGRTEGRVTRPAAPALGAGDGVWEWSGYQEVRDRMARHNEPATPDLMALDFMISLLGTNLAAKLKRCRFERGRHVRRGACIDHHSHASTKRW